MRSYFLLPLSFLFGLGIVYLVDQRNLFVESPIGVFIGVVILFLYGLGKDYFARRQK